MVQESIQVVIEQDRKIMYTPGTGVTNFVYPFKIFDKSELLVYQRNKNDPESVNPADELLSEGIDYTVTGVGDVGGGEIVLTVPTPADQLIIIISNITQDQEVDFKVGGTFAPATINFVMDKLTILDQQLKSLIKEQGLTYNNNVLLEDNRADNILPQLPKPSTAGNRPIWTKSELGTIITAELTEDEDCSLLRSELASQAIGGPGTSLIGYYDPVEAKGKTLDSQLKQYQSEDVTTPGAAFIGYYDTKDAIGRNVKDQLGKYELETKADPGASRIGAFDTLNEVGKTVNTFLNELQSDIPARHAGVLSGLTVSNEAGDTDHDIQFETGAAIDSTNTQQIKLLSALIKQIDAPWVDGTNQGGLFAGTVAANTTYHLFVILDPSSGVVDAGFDTSLAAANRPAGFTFYKRVASLYTDSSSNLVQFVQLINKPDFFMLVSITDDHNITTAGSTLETVSVPTGLNFEAVVSARLTPTDNRQAAFIISPLQTDQTPTELFCDLFADASAARQQTSIVKNIPVNTSAQIRVNVVYVAGATGLRLQISTAGWVDGRIL